MSTPLVFKFGGASVKDAESVRNVAAIIERYPDRPMVVVISAMGKMTNAFETVVACWAQGDLPGATEALQGIQDFHAGIIAELFDKVPADLQADLAQWYEDLGQLVQPSDRSYSEQYDSIVHHGELISTRIVQAFVNTRVAAQWLDTRTLVKTDDQFRRATVQWGPTQECIAAAVQESKVYMVQGFIGSDPAGRPTTLGREGSDYTGAVFAYCLGANSLTIWKDVPGMLNGDPKTFQNTTLIEELPFGEAIELAFYGASIIHPKTIQPLQKKGIPLHIKSFVDPAATGTVINSAEQATPQVPNFILKKNQALLSISTMDLAFIAEHHLSAVYQLFAGQGVVVNLMRNTATKAVFCLNNDAIIIPKVIAALEGDFNLTFTSNVELLTIRHYTESDVIRETQGLTILQEQRTPDTMQFAFQRH
jgi:aspartate kinase